MDPKLAQLEKRVAELEAFAREQMAESIALGVALQTVLSLVSDRGAVRDAFDAQVAPWQGNEAGAVPVPDAVRMLVRPRLAALREALAAD